jgi:hypothetical protein
MFSEDYAENIYFGGYFQDFLIKLIHTSEQKYSYAGLNFPDNISQ